MDTITEIRTISKAAPADISMDYERLRTQGIGHLEELATKIWTDFNVHDPGITILEVLCYAITDLGYRANLPIQDLLAAPSSDGKRPFFTAEEILPICPVTGNDFRKLLIDYPGIRNVWIDKDCPDSIWVQKEEILYISFDDNDNELANSLRSQILDRIKETYLPQPPLPPLNGVGLEDAINEILENDIFTVQGFSEEGIATLKAYTPDDTMTPLDENDQNVIDQLVERLEALAYFLSCAFPAYERTFKSITASDVEGLLDEYGLTLNTEISELLNKLIVQDNPLTDDFGIVDIILIVVSAVTAEEVASAIRLVTHLLCNCSWFKTSQEENTGLENMKLNGLYNICIDTYRNIDPGSKQARKFINKIEKYLCKHRNLGEDVCRISIMPSQLICICLDLEVESETDEKAVMAKVLYNIQRFLTPPVRFYSLQERLDQGLSCEAIFDGPLLKHGFIDDEELEAAIIPEKIRLSDLYNIIMSVEGVVAVKELKLKKIEEDCYVETDEWCFDYQTMDDAVCPIKPVIDLCCSTLQIRKNGLSISLKEQDVEDLIELYRLEEQNFGGNANTKVDFPIGTFRPDLGDYISIQEEFPNNYGLGEEGIAIDAPPLRKAQVKQLQAFLLFFDRILADYLQQLMHVKDLLCVDQDPNMATYFYQSLYQIPGVQELINDYVFVIGQDGIDQLEQAGLSQLILDELGNHLGEVYYGSLAFEEAMNTQLGTDWLMNKNVITNAFQQNIQTADEWEQYQSSDQTLYIQELQKIVESKETQFGRKHRLLNHLLARFGESFTDYVIHVFDSRQQHLAAKADFLSALPELGKNKAKAYNYKQKDGHRPEVWNTNNVSGLKNRVYHLLGMGGATTESVIQNPIFRIDEKEDKSKDRPYKFFTLVRLNEQNEAIETLLVSKKSYSIRMLKKLKPGLYKLIDNAENYSIKDIVDTEQSQVVFSATIGGKSVELESTKRSRIEAEYLLEQVLDLIHVELKGGFHLIEHILLRPNDLDDYTLQMANTCDLSFCPVDPYSFWVSVIIPAWKGKFTNPEFLAYFMQLMRMETPAHIALCFRLVKEEDTMQEFEYRLEQWRESLANCTPDECEITEKANQLIDLLNELPCHCDCTVDFTPTSICGCPEPDVIG